MNIYRLYSVQRDSDNDGYLFMFLPAGDGVSGSHVDFRSTDPCAYRFDVVYNFTMIEVKE